jgi:glycosyltransferase involved in cell wall biosynthesis
LLLLRWTQSRTFRRAEGVIFLTRYAQTEVTRLVETTGAVTTIPHGVDGRFAGRPREQQPMSQYSVDRPFRILYVSIIDVYKHQWHVAEAVAQLRNGGFPVVLDLVGPAYPPALARLKKVLTRIDPTGRVVRYVGAVPYDELHARYAQAQVCVFGSSCETMPNILLEGMASGLPIACSNRGPMPEVLGDAGVYFDPESPADIARALRELIESPGLRARLAQASFDRSQAYSWPRCAAETFEFLRAAAVARSSPRAPGRQA